MRDSGSTSRRVVVTGLGAVTPVGMGVKAFWQALRDGTSGIDEITLYDASAYPCRVAAEVRGFEPREFMSAKRAVTVSRFSQFGVGAARMAYDDAGLAGSPRAARFAVCIGSSANAAYEIQDSVGQFLEGGPRRVTPSTVLETAGHAVTGHVSVELGLKGQTMTLASGCSTGLDVVQWGYGQIRAGRAAGVLVGATEAPLSSYTHAAFTALGVLSRWPGPPRRALRPFDAASDGLVLGEGAGALVLEDLDHARARGANIYAEVLGFASISEGLDLRAVDPSGAALGAAIRAGLTAASLQIEDIDYINAHGNGLPDYDRSETAAYRAVFGAQADSIPVSSVKAVTGQSLAAAGALQVLAGCFALGQQFLPPTVNHDIPAAGCDLDYVPNRGRAARVGHVMIVAHAMGGTHSVLILGGDPDAKDAPGRPSARAGRPGPSAVR